VSFLTAPEWTSTNDSEEQMNFSCQSLGFASILPFASTLSIMKLIFAMGLNTPKYGQMRSL
jgi:hypothetical protein